MTTADDTRAGYWVLLVVGVFLRFFRLDGQSVWLDEGLQYFAATGESLRDVFDRAISMSNPPLSHWIHHLFLQIADSDFFFRLPSTIFGIASLPLFHHLASRLFGRKVAIWCLAVFSLSPLHIWYCQEARMYALTIVLTLLSSIAVLAATENRKLSGWVVYTLSVIAGFYTHIFFVFLVVAHFSWVVLFCREQWLRFVIAIAIGLISFVPLYGDFIENFVVIKNEEVGPAARSGDDRLLVAIPYTLFTYAVGTSFGPTVGELHFESSRPWGPIVFYGALVATIFGFALLQSLLSKRKRELWICLLAIGLPLLCALLVSLHIIFRVRYTLVSLPFFCVLIGTGIAELRSRAPRIGQWMTLAIFVLTVISLCQHYFHPRYAKEDVRSAVELFATFSSDAVLISNASNIVNRYMDPKTLRERHVGVTQVSAELDEILGRTEAAEVYLLIARDWQKEEEARIRDIVRVDDVATLPGVRMLKIRR